LAYVYDGDGQRVRKLIGENLRFIYDMHGQQIAEFDGANGNLKKEYIYGASGLVATVEPTAVNTNGTHYTTPDHLGSPRIVTNSSSSVVSRHDFMPFGEELIAGIGGRTSGMGYGIVDGLRQKFTSKERDNETGLDYFINRYCSSTQGRFTSADPFMGSGKTDDPQSWNRYAYVLNNPVRLVDRDGLDAQEPKKNRHQLLNSLSRRHPRMNLNLSLRKLEHCRQEHVNSVQDRL
jgi:RHS repeat-associated protein